ncbi:hypothetical protein SAMN05216371_6297 [Streptomyces sp. TLI_053]|uniref:hypothetical protein n=1 Tax=Streptomyces sp. TLI_053 TaxID=1855352 RepID=UPI00087B9090|nr:hypothetical protein [Streptomyces sp. TLI_053]SDT80320.1 hypothetical protein SAMN05216371_6297 [Streptomyces sp. TLI_053]
MHPAAIAFQDPARLHARCEISGVRRFTLRPGYETTVAVPDGGWEPLPDGYPERFAPSVFTRDSGLVELFRLPETVFDVPTATALVEMLGDPFPITLGETTDPPGLSSTHTHPDTGLRLGLHIDNHQPVPYPTRETARRRLCVNLGPGSRYLLLATTDIKSVCRTVHADYATHTPTTADLRLYVTLRRPIHALRLRIDPGEGWLAPTAVLPYDESTAGLPLPSVTASWLGHWDRGLFPPLI